MSPKFTTLFAALFSAVFLTSFQYSFALNITLDQAVLAAYENNQELKAQFYSAQAAKSLKHKAVGGFLPKVALDINRGDKKYKIGDNQTVRGNVNTRDFNISQELFNGGKSIFDFKRAKSLVKKEEFLLSSKKQSVALEVIESYINILKTVDLLDIERKNIKSYKRILDYTKKKLRVRDATKSDLAKAKADYISAVSNEKILKNNLSSAISTFSKLTGYRNDEINALAEFSIEEIDEQLKYFNKISVKKLALDNNPDLRAQEQEHKSVKYERLMAKADLSPTARLSYQMSEDKKSIYFNNRSQRNDSIFINFHIPIFNSGVEYANIGYANNKESQERHNLENARQKIIELSSMYLNDINNLNHNYKSAKEIEGANQVYFSSVKREERFGVKSIIDLLIARQQLYQSQTNRVNYYYDYILAVFKIKTLIGRLDF